MSDELSYTCPRCGRTSHHLQDVMHSYCGACHVFRDQLLPVTRVSQITAMVHTLHLPITVEQLNRYETSDVLLQEAFPDLSAPEREFIKSGITPAEWEQFLVPPPIEEEENDD